MSIPSSRDALLFAYTPPFPIDGSLWLELRESLALRQEVDVWLLDGSLDENERLERLADYARLGKEKGVERVSMVTIGPWPHLWSEWLQATAWMEYSPALFQAEAWSPQDWAHLIANANTRRERSADEEDAMVPLKNRWILIGNKVHDHTGEMTEQSTTCWYEMASVVLELRLRGIEADFQFEEKQSPFPRSTLFQFKGSHSEPAIYVRWNSGAVGTPPHEAVGQDVLFVEEVFPCTLWYEAILAKRLESFRNPRIVMRTPIPTNEVSRLDRNRRDAMIHSDSAWSEDYSQLLGRIQSMLPSEYRGREDEVSPQSMGSAAIVRGADGLVPWDKIWTTFCDLAIAGGPPHRGKLLESVTKEEIYNEPEKYRAVVQEIRRGIQLAANVPTQECDAVGWVGVICSDEQMATWILRAILAENVAARREEAVVYVPAGPSFRVEREIKNVITSVAKTVHYWRHHRKK